MSNQARVKNLKVPPRKARLVANMVKGKTAKEANAILLYTPNKSAIMIRKLIDNAVANVNQKRKTKPEHLVVQSIWVDPGPIIRMFTARAQGRATPKNKRTSHISVVLTEKK